ncbi:hypothetical protein GC194_09115 [bacterium]|nr:hypothetical protein [bacterium]
MKRIKINRSNCVRPIVLLSILFIALFSGSSCQRTPDVQECCYDCSCEEWPCPESNAFTYPYTDTLYQSDSFLRYWFFPIGSWWVYKRVDTTADVYDTAVVTRQDHGIACNCKILGDVCRERYWLEVMHSYNFLKFKGATNVVRIDTEFKTNWAFAHSGSLLNTSGAPLVTLPYTSAEEAGYPIWYEKKDVFKTSRYIFQNPVTYNFQNPNIPADSTIRQTFVIVQDIGLVYFYERGNSAWELINYHINQ